MNKLLIGLLAGVLAISGPAIAQQSGGSASGPAASSSAQSLADGEIRKIDKAQAKLTIRHGPIANLDMPPMTMVFQAKDASVLDKVAVGDKVRFRAEKEGSAYVVTRVEKVQ